MLIRPLRFRDLPAVRAIAAAASSEEVERRGADRDSPFTHWQQIYPVVRALALFPNPYQYAFNLHVAVEGSEVAGFIQTSPANRDHTRWHIDTLAVAPDHRGRGIGQALLDYTFDHHQGVKFFTIEIDTRNLPAIGLVTRKGFRRYATLHYFQLPSERLAPFAAAPPPPGLRPFRRKDAAALVQLHNACTPSPMRMIDARSVGDFDEGLVARMLARWRCKLGFFEESREVVFDERKRLIGYLHVTGQFRAGPHAIHLLVHPGYDDLAQPLLRYGLAKLAAYPPHGVLAGVPDYQPAKIAAFEQEGFGLLTADHLFVRDSLLTIRMPTRQAAVTEDNAFKPAFFEP